MKLHSLPSDFIRNLILISVDYYRDCRDAYERGITCSGLATIRPEGAVDQFSYLVRPPFNVYCDMKSDGGGWTVFQRRIGGYLDFNLNWDDYVHGFGNPRDEFWLGLSNLHRLTGNTSHTNMLRVDLGDFDGNTAYAKYSTFRVGDSVSEYTLTVYGYTGTAGNSFSSRHNGRRFTTKDKDNDNLRRGNCAQQYKGGWWYDACYDTHLNGLYYHTGPQTGHDGIAWRYWRGTNYSLKVTELKVRRVG